MGPCNVIIGTRNVNVGPCNVIKGLCNVIMGPRNVNRGPWNVIRVMQYYYGNVQSDYGTV